MSTYLYEAYDKDNQISHGQHEASSREEVVEHLAKHSLTPISIEAIRTKRAQTGILSIQLFESLNSVDIMFLVRNLSTTVKAGLSVVESLDILIQDTGKKLMKKILEEAQAMIKNGKSLSAAFEAHKESFPAIFIGMVKAGEVSGKLDNTLAELARYLSKEYALRSKVKSALTYPIILLCASTVVVILMLVFVLPKLTKSFISSGVKLPWITKAFLFISQMLTWSFILDIVVVAGLIWFFLYFRRTKTGKKFFFFIISHTPVASKLVKKIALVRFTRIFGNLIASGLSVIDSIEIASQSINNQSYTHALEKTVTDIRNGVSVSGALSKYPELFPRLLISLIVVGERTGTLEEILITFSDFYEEEVDNTLKELTSVLEPVLLLVMGLMIGSIAVSIILPIYQLVGHFV
jgi:type II secretory pathway component PulF